MKRINTKIYYLLPFVFLYANDCLSQPYVYVAEGEVSGIYGSDEDKARVDVQPEDYVRFEFLVDKDIKGFRKGDGEIECLGDYSHESGVEERFYAELLDTSYYIDDTYYGYDTVNYYGFNFYPVSTTDSSYSILEVGPVIMYFNSESIIEDWEVGEPVIGSHGWHDSVSDGFVSMLMDLEITEIREYDGPKEIYNCEQDIDPETEDNSNQYGSGGNISWILLLILSLYRLKGLFLSALVKKITLVN